MEENMKKILSLFLSIHLCVMLCIPSFAKETPSFEQNELARLNSSLQGTSIQFLNISADEIVYTFERNGETFKYVDSILSENSVKTNKYKLAGKSFVYYDTTYYTITDSLVESISLKDGYSATYLSSGQDSYDVFSNDYNWSFYHKYTGDTSFEITSVAVIAVFLAGAIGGTAGAFLAVAAYLFDKLVSTIYYTMYVYKDLNSPTLRPAYKHVVYMYTDPEHKHATDPNSTTFIVDP